MKMIGMGLTSKISFKTQLRSSKFFQIFLSFLFFIFFLLGCEGNKELYAQTELQNYKIPPETEDGWETTNISNVALNAKLLLKMVARIKNKDYINIHSVLIVKDGKLVLEEYFPGKTMYGVSIDYNIDSLHELHSVTKSFTSALIGIAIGQKMIPGVDSKAVDLLPKYEDILRDNLKKGISLKHLLTMTTGIKWDEWTYPPTDPRNDNSKLNRSPDFVRYVLSQPMETLPGWEYAYNSGISLVIGEIIPSVSNMNLAQFAEKFLFQPLGIEKYYWSRDRHGVYIAGGGLQLRPRDMAKFGLLFLNNGQWKGKQIVPESWIKESTKDQVGHLKVNLQYGYQWWPRTFWAGNRYVNTINAEGRGGQFIIIVPELKLVAVFTGWNDNDLYRQPFRLLEGYILPSVTEP